MSKHTPGPWSAKDRDNQISIPLKSIDCERIGFSVCFVNGHREQEAKANAHLIAAAPELLSALHGALALLEAVWPEHEDSSVYDAARAAIAKAVQQ